MGYRRSRTLHALLALAGVLIVVDVACCAALLFFSRACCSQSAERVGPNHLIVLLYGADPDDLAARLDESERLLSLDLAARAFCAGGARPDRGVFHCREVVAQLAGRGIDRSRLSADVASFDTRGNLAAAFAAAGPTREPLVVSDALHLLRVRMLADEVAGGRRYQTSATREPRGLHLIMRLHWEIAAYLSTWLPASLRATLTGLTRS
jgi:hypothetical protein